MDESQTLVSMLLKIDDTGLRAIVGLVPIHSQNIHGE